MAVHKSKGHDSTTSNVLHSRSQSEIIASRRKARRARINTVLKGVNHISAQNSDLSSPIIKNVNSVEQNQYDIYSAAKEVAASKNNM